MERRVAIYLRTSTERQSKGLESQRLTLETYLNQQQIKDFYIFEDFGVSGAKSKRPGLEKLMFAVKRGERESSVGKRYGQKQGIEKPLEEHFAAKSQLFFG